MKAPGLRASVSYVSIPLLYDDSLLFCNESNDAALAETSDGSDTHAVACQDAAAQQVREALAQLPVAQRAALTLAYAGGYSQAEIARAQGVPLGTVKGRVRLGLWARLAPLLVVVKPRTKPGRPRTNDRPLFDGVIWVLRTGAQWGAVPQEFGPKSTVHDRFQEWVRTGAFARAWTLLLAEYDEFVGLDLHWPSADGCLIKAPLGKKGGLEKRNARAVTHRPGQMWHQAPPADRGHGCARGLHRVRGQSHRHEEAG